MAEGIITRRGGGGGALEITGQEIITSEFQETISKFDSVFVTKGNITAINKLSNPSILPTGQSISSAFSPDGIYLAIGHDNSPRITIYKRNVDTFTKLSNPTIIPGASVYSCSWSPDGVHLVLGIAGPDLMFIYKRDGDVFTKLSQPNILPVNFPQNSSFSPDGNYLAVAISQSPFLQVYTRSGDNFNLLPNSNIDIALPNAAQSVSFSPNGDYLAVAYQFTSPCINVYKRNGDDFIKLPNPIAFGNFAGLGRVKFSHDGKYFILTSNQAADKIQIYEMDYNNDTFNRIGLANSFMTNAPQGLSYNKILDYFVIGHNTSPFIDVYKKIDTSFIKTSNLINLLPEGSVNGIEFSNDSQYLAAAIVPSPFIALYKITTANTGVFKTSNTIKTDRVQFGYALEDGVQGETKTIMSLFREDEQI